MAPAKLPGPGKTRATRPRALKAAGAPIPAHSTAAPPAPAERPSTQAYLEAFRAVVTPERLRAMAADLVADFDDRETPLKDKFAVWSRFAAYAIGTPLQQAETGDENGVEELLRALLYARETDTSREE